MKRRRLLASSGLGLSIGMVGCLADDTVNNPIDDGGAGSPGSGDPEEGGEIDLPEEPSPVDLDGDGPDAWRQYGYDQRNSKFAAGVTGPGDDAEIDWIALGDDSLFPPVVDGEVYLAENWTDGGAVSLAGRDGTKRWTNSSLPPSRWQPALYDDWMLTITRTENNLVRLHALEKDDGEISWETEITASSASNPPTGPTVTGDMLFVGSDTGILALDADTGERAWNAELGDHVVERDDGSKGLTIWSKPAVTSERVVTSDTNARHPSPLKAFGVDRETGETEWTAALELGEHWQLSGHPVVGADRVFLVANHSQPVAMGSDSDSNPISRLYALDEPSGAVLWYWEVEGSTFSQPAFADGYIFVSDSQGTLRAIDVADRSIAWTYDAPTRWVRSPTITRDFVYVTHGTELVAVSVEHGALAWSLSVGNRLSSPIVANESVYVVTENSRGRESEVVAVRES